MTESRKPRLPLPDLVDELCDPHPHAESIPYWDVNRNQKFRRHLTTMPGLLTQVAELFATNTIPDGGSTANTSKPPGRWDAIATHTQITLAAARWCWTLRLNQRATVEGNIRQLLAQHAGLDPDVRDTLAGEIRRWHTWASVVTGWKSVPMDPQAPCPAHNPTTDTDCGARTLRINADEHEAFCATCGTYWGPRQLPMLIETIRTYHRASDAARDAAKARARADRAKRESAA